MRPEGEIVSGRASERLGTRLKALGSPLQWVNGRENRWLHRLRMLVRSGKMGRKEGECKRKNDEETTPGSGFFRKWKKAGPDLKALDSTSSQLGSRSQSLAGEKPANLTARRGAAK